VLLHEGVHLASEVKRLQGLFSQQRPRLSIAPLGLTSPRLALLGKRALPICALSGNDLPKGISKAVNGLTAAHAGLLRRGCPWR
jgi:hypothetical protein